MTEFGIKRNIDYDFPPLFMWAENNKTNGFSKSVQTLNFLATIGSRTTSSLAISLVVSTTHTFCYFSKNTFDYDSRAFSTRMRLLKMYVKMQLSKSIIQIEIVWSEQNAFIRKR